jgi:hypothetical protein
MTEFREHTATLNGESQTIARMNTVIPHSSAPAGFRAEGNPRDPGYEANKHAGRSVEVESMLARANEDAVRKTKTTQVGQVKESIAETIAGRESNSVAISGCPRGMITSGLAKSLTRTLANLS